jgi:hypothetical protein
MFGLSTEQWTVVGGIAAVLTLLLASRSSLLGAHDRLVKALLEDPTKRDRIGRALGVSRILDGYRWALEGGLDKLDRWMGGYGELARGYG